MSRSLIALLTARAVNLMPIVDTSPEDPQTDIKLALSTLPSHVRALVEYKDLDGDSTQLYCHLTAKMDRYGLFDKWERKMGQGKDLSQRIAEMALEEIKYSGCSCPTCKRQKKQMIENKWYTCKDCNGGGLYRPDYPRKLKIKPKEWELFTEDYKDIMGWLLNWDQIATSKINKYFKEGS